MYNLIPINPFIIRGEIEHDRKKKAWIDEANGSKKGKSSGNNGIKRKKDYTSQSSDEDADEKIDDESEHRSAVDLLPPWEKWVNYQELGIDSIFLTP